MRQKIAARVLAMLLALAMLMAGTALAELEISGDEWIENGVDLAFEAGELVLSEADVDIDLDVSLDGFAPEAVAPEAAATALEEGQQGTGTVSLVLGVKEKYALDAEAIGAGKRVTFKSSNRKIATVTSKGVVKGVKKGEATITCKAGGKAVAYYAVQVLPAPGKVTLSKASVTLGVKESVALMPSISSGTHASFTWSSKNKAVASVSKAGVITGKKKGSTTITVKTQNGKSATVKVTVKKAPGKVTLNRESASLSVKGTLKLKATLPANTYSAITWMSSNKKVAKVSASGKVTAVAAGKATITASTFNGCEASCTVTVTASPESVKYRALLIGEEHFYNDICTRNRGDVLHMAEMLRNVRGLYGGSYSITQKYDLSTKQVLKAIKTTFADADEDDVSLFFIATHGDANYDGEYAGMLSTVPNDMLLLGELAEALQAVPGKVIVILESCGAGAAIYASNGAKSDKALTYEEAKKRTEAFDAAVIRAFSNADTGVRVPARADGAGSGDVRANTGEFRVENKFYVLAASRYQELSWGSEWGDAERSFNYFTLWLTQGIGVSGSMPADANNNGQTTLSELYRYISDVGDDYPFNTQSGVYYQHVQVYPKNSSYVLFCR